MAFHEIRFPDNISRGAHGGPERRTQVASAQNTATTIAAPLTTSVIWRLSATFYVAP